MVQNKLLFEDSSCFSTGGWLYSSTVHIGLVEGVLRNFSRDIILGHRFRELFECIMAICY